MEIDKELLDAVGDRVTPDTADLETVKVPEKPKRTRAKKPEMVPASALMDAMALLEELKAEVDLLKTTTVTIEEPKPMLDMSQPYTTYRSIGSVSYEQLGKKYDGGKRLIEDE